MLVEKMMSSARAFGFEVLEAGGAGLVRLRLVDDRCPEASLKVEVQLSLEASSVLPPGFEIYALKGGAALLWVGMALHLEGKPAACCGPRGQLALARMANRVWPWLEQFVAPLASAA